MLTTLAHGIGKGLVAGFAGTAAMTISSTIEQKGARPRIQLRARESDGKGLGNRWFQDAPVGTALQHTCSLGGRLWMGGSARSLCGLRGYHPAPHRRATSRRCGAAPS